MNTLCLLSILELVTLRSKAKAKLFLMVSINLVFVLPSFTAQAQETDVTSCPASYTELQIVNDVRVCDFEFTLTMPFTGSPSLSAEGRQVINNAASECRPIGTVITGGDRGVDTVFVQCNIELSADEIILIEEEEERQREEEEEAERQREEEEEAERQREEEEEAERQREEEEEEERQREEEAEAERQREAEREREEQERQPEDEERQREEAARNAPFVFDLPEAVQGSPTESSIASALVSLCTQLRGEQSRTAAQDDLVERCIDLNRERESTKQLSALTEVAARQYTDIGQSLTFLNTIQVGNIGGRLAAIAPALRQNSKDVAYSETDHPQKGLLASRATNQAGGAAGESEPNGRFGVFVLGTTGDGDKRASSLSSGFDYRSVSMTVGLDYMLDSSAVIGVAYGYGSTESNFTGGSGSLDIQSDTYSIYVAKAFGRQFTVDAIVASGDIDTKSVRSLSYIANGVAIDQSAGTDIKSDQALLSLGISKSFESFVNIDVGVRYNYIETDIGRFSENVNPDNLGFGLALEIDDYVLKSSTTDLSVSIAKALSTNWGVLVPQIRMNWVHEFESGDRSMTGRFLADVSTIDFRDSGLQLNAAGSTLFSVPIEKLDADYGNLLVGVNALLPHQVSLNVSINKTIGISDFDHVYWTLSARKDF